MSFYKAFYRMYFLEPKLGWGGVGSGGLGGRRGGGGLDVYQMLGDHKVVYCECRTVVKDL